MWSIFSRNLLSSFPYEVLEILYEDHRSLWKIHKGRKKQGNEIVSIFICECERPGDKILDLAKVAHKRLKTLKHPGILKYIDSLESEKAVYIVTEEVKPVLKWISDIDMTSKDQSNSVAWGLFQITKALSFLNNDVKLVHNNINSSSVFVTKGGEWKLFGLEYATETREFLTPKLIGQLSVYDPPEFHKSTIGKSQLWSTDIWGFGCLIWEVFNQQLDKSPSLQHTSKIPKQLLPMYCELVGANPLMRPNPQEVINKLRQSGQFYNNDLIETLNFLDEIQIKDSNEKHRFFSNLTAKLDNIPEFIQKNKILPALLTAHEFSDVGSVLLPPLFKIGHILEDRDYESHIVPCVVRMFASTDRATRLKLLQQMEALAEHLDQKTVNDEIFQPLITGFQDTNPTIREHSVKAVLYLAPKMNYNNLNVEIMKHFARLQSKDDQGGIRTNTTVCLGKIASYLHPKTRQKCLVSAFTRAMRDPFPPSRVAGVTAIAATQQYYSLSDVSNKVLPSLSQLTIDPEKSVRDAVFRVFKGFLGKLEKVSEDPDLKEIMEKEVTSGAATSAILPSSWAGWAVGALASKFYKTPPVQVQGSTPHSQGLVESCDVSSPESRVISSSESRNVSEFKNVSMKSPRTFNRVSSDGKNLINDDKWAHDSEENDNLGASTNPGDGWEDIEEWGELEVPPEESDPPSLIDTSFTKSPENWTNVQNNDDFFSSFDKQEKTKSYKQQQKPTSKDSSWDTWDFDEEKQERTSDRADEQRRAREERKNQRLKQIEAKRAARSGPMKLGAKKLDPLL